MKYFQKFSPECPFKISKSSNRYASKILASQYKLYSDKFLTGCYSINKTFLDTS